MKQIFREENIPVLQFALINYSSATAKHIYFFLNPIYNFEIMPPAISTTNNTDVIVVENNTATPATRRDSTSSTIDAAQDMKTMTITPTSKDVTSEKNYWNTFYSKFDLQHPSQFCVTTAIEAADRSQPIIEFGCGNGRDSMYFATHGFKVYGCDLSKEGIEKNVEKSKGLANITFEVVE